MVKIFKLALLLATLVISFSYGQETRNKKQEIKGSQKDPRDLSKLILYGAGFSYEGNPSEDYSTHDGGISGLTAYHISSNTFLGIIFGTSPRKKIYFGKAPSILLRDIEASVFIKPFVRRYWKVENRFIMSITDFNISLAKRYEDNYSKQIRREARSMYNLDLKDKTIDWGLFIKAGITYRITEALLLEIFLGKFDLKT